MSLPKSFLREFSGLGQLDGAVFKAALTEARRVGRLPTKVVQGLMCHQELAHLVEIADLFSLDSDAELRLQANRILFSSALAAPSDRVVRRALEDVDPRIVELAVADLCARHDEAGVRALGQLLARTDDAGLNRAQRKAVAFLGELRTPAAREALHAALAGRRFALELTSRLTSVLVARGLERFGDPASLKAVRTWRWSPAGILCLFTRNGMASE